MSTTHQKQVTAPNAKPEAATSHKEDNPNGSTSSKPIIPSWRSAIVAWYAGGVKPPLTIMREAAKHGVADRIPPVTKDRVRALTLAGFDAEDLVAAVPELNPIHVIDLAERVPGEAMSILDKHLQGYTPLEIEARVDTSRPTVYYWLGKAGLKPHKRSRDELTVRQRRQIVRAFNNGEPMTVIASRFNASIDQVRYAIRES